MKITVNMPHHLEAESSEDEVTINPRFLNAIATSPAMYLTVEGKVRGTERRFVLSVSARDGKLTLQEIKDEVTPLFDLSETQRRKKREGIEDPQEPGTL